MQRAKGLHHLTSLLNRLASKIPMWIMEQVFLSGLCSDLSEKTLEELQKRLDANSLTAEKGWQVRIGEKEVEFVRTVRGVRESYYLSKDRLRGSEVEKLTGEYEEYIHHFAQPAQLVMEAEEHSIAGPASLLEKLLTIGRKGVSINRFKGLGEMNDDQLWQTTLDPVTRTLLQVTVSDVENASDVFSTLMGDVVVPYSLFLGG
ncbi:DNA gyrase subunit B family protein [Entomobacter blattae]|uniref:DNA topoisomerase (ATP-hydrolyzing) n=1 Tax=Entomobacter blattae TaxID=2762277 RepID=A0A7H1NUZ1_9PROT|nr:hypothetical protein [Entomobacter blattae]QNT79601.1 DNA gyrase subunit B [Entomobacter blattae]